MFRLASYSLESNSTRFATIDYLSKSRDHSSNKQKCQADKVLQETQTVGDRKWQFQEGVLPISSIADVNLPQSLQSAKVKDASRMSAIPIGQYICHNWYAIQVITDNYLCFPIKDIQQLQKLR